MAIYVCERCGVIENTALTDYWWDVYREHKPALCSQCATGTWHGKFPRKTATNEHLSLVLNPEQIGKAGPLGTGG